MKELIIKTPTILLIGLTIDQMINKYIVKFTEERGSVGVLPAKNRGEREHGRVVPAKNRERAAVRMGCERGVGKVQVALEKGWWR